MACVVCQIAPIKADLYILFSPHDEGAKESRLKSYKKKNKTEKMRGNNGIDWSREVQKLGQLTAVKLNMICIW